MTRAAARPPLATAPSIQPEPIARDVAARERQPADGGLEILAVDRALPAGRLGEPGAAREPVRVPVVAAVRDDLGGGMNVRTASVTAARSEVSSRSTPAKPASRRPPSTSPIDTSALSGVPQPPAANPSGTLRAIASSFVERPGCPAARAAALPPASGGSNSTSRQTLSGSATTAADAVTSPPSSRRTVIAVGARVPRAATTVESRVSRPSAILSTRRRVPPMNDTPMSDHAGVELVAVVDGVEDQRAGRRARSAARRPSPPRTRASRRAPRAALPGCRAMPRPTRRGPSRPRAPVAAVAGPGCRRAPRSPRRPGRGGAWPRSTATPPSPTRAAGDRRRRRRRTRAPGRRASGGRTARSPRRSRAGRPGGPRCRRARPRRRSRAASTSMSDRPAGHAPRAP